MAAKDDSLRLDDLEARVAKLEALPQALPAAERVCLRCGGETEARPKMRPSDPQHRVYNCARCQWDFEI